MSHHSTPSGLTNSTDVENKATVLVFVWYIFQEDVHEDMSCALLLPTNTPAADLFKSLHDYVAGKLNWSFCVGICMGRAAAMTGRLSDFTSRVKEMASECESTHCVIHREMLASQKSHLNLTTFCRMWLKLSATLKSTPLTHVSLRSSVRRRTQSRQVSSYTQKWEAF